jgi:hypothetical protein
VREPVQPCSIERAKYPFAYDNQELRDKAKANSIVGNRDINPNGRNLRTVWTIATQPYPEAHFATFPEELAERCIKAGSTDRACGVCGQAWERVTNIARYDPKTGNYIDGGWGEGADPANQHKGGFNSIRPEKHTQTIGFRPTCEHNDDSGRSIVLDPFMGSGTVAYVALLNGRDYIGIELNAEYIKLANKRLKPIGNRPVAQNEVLL